MFSPKSLGLPGSARYRSGIAFLPREELAGRYAGYVLEAMGEMIIVLADLGGNLIQGQIRVVQKGRLPDPVLIKIVSEGYAEAPLEQLAEIGWLITEHLADPAARDRFSVVVRYVLRNILDKPQVAPLRAL